MTNGSSSAVRTTGSLSRTCRQAAGPSGQGLLVATLSRFASLPALVAGLRWTREGGAHATRQAGILAERLARRLDGLLQPPRRRPAQL